MHINARASKNREKLCWSCQGTILLSAAECRFCGAQVDIGASSSEVNQKTKPGEPLDPAHPFYFLYEQQTHEKPPTELPTSQNLEEEKHTSPYQVPLPLLSLIAGSSLLLFSGMLLLFSKEGTLTLQWSQMGWPIYSICGVASIAWGWYASRIRIG